MDIEPGRLVDDGSGSLRSARYGDIYRSGVGALAESDAVFVEGARLQPAWSGRPAFTILELGFGIGANFLATLAAWRRDPGRPDRLDFVSIEAHPLPVADLRNALSRIGASAADASRLLAGWPLALPGLHRIAFDGGRVVLTVALGDAESVASRLALAADAFFLDGFSPACNPAMWSGRLMKQLGRRARPGAIVASYSVAGGVRAALADAGFVTDVAPGFGSKRGRLVGRYAPRWRTWPAPPTPYAWPQRRVLVIGAGLAGSMVARGFAQAGWSVDIVDAAAAPLAGGSGQPRLATHLHLSPDDNRLARLTRAALGLRDERALAETPPTTFPGKLVPAPDDATRDRQRELVERFAMPDAFARRVDAAEARELSGIALAHGGLWLPRIDATDPSIEFDAMRADPAIDVRLDSPIARIERAGSGWLARHAGGGTAGPFPLVVLACAGNAIRLGGFRSIALRPTRGQSSRLRSTALAPLRCLVGGDAYACPLGDGELLVGSTFDERVDLAPDPADDASNLRRLARTIGIAPDRLAVQWRDAITGLRFAPRDRMPLLGWAPDEAAAFAAAGELVRNARLALPQSASLMLATGFGARGALWAPLAARLLPALAEGWPLPIESDLADSVDPCRFLRSTLRGAIH